MVIITSNYTYTGNSSNSKRRRKKSRPRYTTPAAASRSSSAASSSSSRQSSSSASSRRPGCTFSARTSICVWKLEKWREENARGNFCVSWNECNVWIYKESKRRRYKNAQRDVPEQEPEHQKHQYGHQYRRWVHIFFLKECVYIFVANWKTFSSFSRAHRRRPLSRDIHIIYIIRQKNNAQKKRPALKLSLQSRLSL